MLITILLVSFIADIIFFAISFRQNILKLFIITWSNGCNTDVWPLQKFKVQTRFSLILSINQIPKHLKSWKSTTFTIFFFTTLLFTYFLIHKHKKIHISVKSILTLLSLHSNLKLYVYTFIILEIWHYTYWIT
jgi:hypothetical protein